MGTDNLDVSVNAGQDNLGLSVNAGRDNTSLFLVEDVNNLSIENFTYINEHVFLSSVIPGGILPAHWLKVIKPEIFSENGGIIIIQRASDDSIYRAVYSAATSFGLIHTTLDHLPDEESANVEFNIGDKISALSSTPTIYSTGAVDFDVDGNNNVDIPVNNCGIFTPYFLITSKEAPDDSYYGKYTTRNSADGILTGCQLFGLPQGPVEFAEGSSIVPAPDYVEE